MIDLSATAYWSDSPDICEDCWYDLPGCKDPAQSGSCAEEAVTSLATLRRPEVAEWVAETVRRLTANGNMDEYLAKAISSDEALRQFG